MRPACSRRRLNGKRSRPRRRNRSSSPTTSSPGSGPTLSLRGALRVGGLSTFVVLLLLTSFDELESATLGVLAPDIRDSFGVSNGVIVFVSAASGAFLVLGALPMGWLADRYRRPPIIGWASLVFAVFVASCGLVTNAFQLFWARLGVGVAKARTVCRSTGR